MKLTLKLYIANRSFSDRLKIYCHLQSTSNIKLGIFSKKDKSKILYLALVKKMFKLNFEQ